MELMPLIFGRRRSLYPVERGEWEIEFRSFLKACGFNEIYGSIYENSVFSLRPYYWGDDERIARLPNFVFKPTDYKLRWYKYPLRGATANKPLPLLAFCDMLAVCAQSQRTP